MIVGTITMATKHNPTKKSRMLRPFKTESLTFSTFDAGSAEDSTLTDLPGDIFVACGDFRSGLWPSGFVAVLTQGFALGCDVATPLALSKC
jgi:hypothetical protein